MRNYFFIAIVFFFSCKAEKQNLPTPIPFTQKIIEAHNIEMNLPTLEYGKTFYKNDSINYINVFIINDSTIQWKDSIFHLKNDTKVDYTNWIPHEKCNPEPLVKEIFEQYKTLDSETEINIFMSQNQNMEILSAFYYSISTFRFENIKKINLIGNQNNYLDIKYYPQPLGCGFLYDSRDILNITINQNNQLMIQGMFENMTFDSIPNYVTKYYAEDTEGYPSLVSYDKKRIIETIKRLKERDNIEKSTSKKRLKYWSKLLKTNSLVGDFKSKNKYSIIVIQYSKKTEYKEYIKIVDYIHKGTNSLKNDFCLKKFNLAFDSLSPMDSTQNEIIKAMEVVFPNLINSNYYAPPPPPPRKRRRK